MTIDIGVVGATGKLGRRLIALGLQDPTLRIAAGICSQAHPERVKDLGIPCTSDFAIKEKKPLVIGTTGHQEKELHLLEEASKHLPIFKTANFSIGIALLIESVRNLANLLPDFFSISIEETHHIHKKDSPSGTALAIAEVLPEKKDVIITSKRESDVIGEHSVIFDSMQERLTLTHSTKSRDVFAKGALLAAKFLIDKPAGLYGMTDLFAKGLL